MTDTPEPMFLLLKRGYYWRPNAQGYTSSISEAGRYTEAEARAYCRNPDVTMIQASAMTDTQLKPEPVAWLTRERFGDNYHYTEKAPHSPHAIGLYTQDQLDAAVCAERERCARLCEGNFDSEMKSYGDYFARAIREGE